MALNAVCACRWPRGWEGTGNPPANPEQTTSLTVPALRSLPHSVQTLQPPKSHLHPFKTKRLSDAEAALDRSGCPCEQGGICIPKKATPTAGWEQTPASPLQPPWTNISPSQGRSGLCAAKPCKSPRTEALTLLSTCPG